MGPSRANWAFGGAAGSGASDLETKRDCSLRGAGIEMRAALGGKSPADLPGNKQVAAVSRSHSRRECEPKELLVCAGARVGL